jgi:hypothetical protein
MANLKFARLDRCSVAIIETSSIAESRTSALHET